MEKKQTQRKRNECAALGSIRRSYVEVCEEWKASDSYNEGERIFVHPLRAVFLCRS